MEQLQEDITCSICLDVFNEPVSIECGHNFCRGCLSTHWNGISTRQHCCPECRAPCSKDRMSPDARIKNMVEKITKHLREETELQEPEFQPGCPVQLVRLDEEGALILEEEALSHCLEQGGVGDAPVCLVSIIGEQRCGKSFLLNYLLRRLQCHDVRNASWMGQEDQRLEGFDWRADIQRVTKGVWAWSQPFWVPAEGGRVAVLLVDTEGSMDIERSKETSIKLSALSMLLSSYQILNIGRRVKDPDLEYLEMFLQVAKVVGETYELEPIQHLDLLVRDWSSSPVLGYEGGKMYQRDIKQKLEETSPCKHPKTLEALKRGSTHCYLMPFPGKGIMTGSEGRLKDMDADFQESLRDYITTVVNLASQHICRNRYGETLTGTQLADRIKGFSDVMKKRCFGFSSPCQMAITFHNQRVLDRARTEHAVFLREKDSLSQCRIDCLKVTPSAMAKQCLEQRRSLLERCRKEMKELEKATLLEELETELTWEAKTFLEIYRGRYESHTINQRAKDKACRHHTLFLKEKDGLSQRRTDCLKVTPSTMMEQFAEQRRLLLERCRGEMKEPEKETLLAELEAELTQVAKIFLETYGRRYENHTINQRAMDRAHKDHSDFLKEKASLFKNRIHCLKVAPSAMGDQFVEQRKLLLERCRMEMMEPERETLLTELETELTQEAKTFLKTYGRCYQSHFINQRAMDRTHTDYTAFLREKDGLSQCRINCLKVTPSAMAKQCLEQRRSLLERCRKEMKELEKATLLEELETELTWEAKTFLEIYRGRYESHTINQRAKDKACRHHTLFLKEKDGLSQRRTDCLKVTPSTMMEQFAEQRRLLLERCRGEMKEPEKETLLAELEAELTQVAKIFLETYGRRYENHTINQRAMDRAHKDHSDFLKEKASLFKNRIHCLKVAPSAMGDQFVEQRKLLLERCRMEMMEPERETLLTELETELTQEAKTFLKTYGRCYQSHFINQRAMDRTHTDYTAFLREKDGLSQCRINCLKVTPSAMAKQCLEQRRSLLEWCRKEMKELEKATLLEELETELTWEAKTFLEIYRGRYESHTINQRAMDKARRHHTSFLKEKDGLSQRSIDCLKVTPRTVMEQFAEQRRLLLERCRGEMKEPEKETLLAELEAELTQVAKIFLETYERRYENHTINQRAMDRAHKDHSDFLKEKDGLSKNRIHQLKVTPSAMVEQFMEQRRLLLERCWEEMKEPEKATLLAELESELTEEAETFLETYGWRYESHTMNWRAMDRAHTDHATFQKEKDDQSQQRVNYGMRCQSHYNQPEVYNGAHGGHPGSQTETFPYEKLIWFGLGVLLFMVTGGRLILH